MARCPDWLVAGPIAHRGLHDASAGVIENTPSAFAAAIDARYAIETDLRAAACDTPMVFHDATLERLTQGAGALADHDAHALDRTPFRDTPERMPTLAALLAQVAGRVPLFLEIKSDFSDQAALAARIAEDLRGYAGPVAVMSFDPRLVGAFRRLAPHIPRGLGVTRVRRCDLPHASSLQRFALTHMLLAGEAQPHFISCEHSALEMPGPRLMRKLARRPAIAWTVRTAGEANRARRNADAIIFEGFTP
jgi:glycerophosphoryl diester phosphodiesterase